MSVAVLGLGLVLLRCGSSDSPGGGGGGGGNSDAGAGHAGNGTAGANHGGSGPGGAANGGGHSAGSAGKSGGAAGASDAGAGGDLGAGGDDIGAGGAAVAETLEYVFNAQLVPVSNGTYALDLDGNGTPENQYAKLSTALIANGFAPQAQSTAQTQAGVGLQLAQLTVLDSNLVKSAGASLDIARAVVHASPDFGGTGLFAIDAAAPRAKLFGAIAAGVFNNSAVKVGEKPQKLLLRLPMGVAVDLPVSVFSVSTHVAANGLTLGQLNGAILGTDVNTLVPPALASAFNAACGGTPMPACATYLTLFDANHDNTITADELRANDLVKSLLQSDVKLFDAQGKFAPDPSANSVKDSFSVGIGFTAVTALIAQ